MSLVRAGLDGNTRNVVEDKIQPGCYPVIIPQHAIATCCRGCLWKWHRIEKGLPLSDAEIGFVVELVMGSCGDQIQWTEGRGTDGFFVGRLNGTS
jgi:hypothetical protein